MRELGRVGVASHDAGGAIILATFLYINNIDFMASLRGPSVEVFGRFFGTKKSTGCFKT